MRYPKQRIKIQNNLIFFTELVRLLKIHTYLWFDLIEYIIFALL